MDLALTDAHPALYIARFPPRASWRGRLLFWTFPMFAIIKTGGRQYRVAKGDQIIVEKLEGDSKGKVAFSDVLMIGDGDKVTVGAPLVSGAKVSGEIVETRKGEKTLVFKKKRRNTYRRKRGHRQVESVVKITAVSA